MADGRADELADIAARAIRASDEPDVDVFVSRIDRGLARYSLNSLNQHARMLDVSVTARVVRRDGAGARVASTVTTDATLDGVLDAVKRAGRAASNASCVQGYPAPLEPDAACPSTVRVSAATADCTADDRAALVSTALEVARAAGLTAAGLLETSVHSIAVANRAGLTRAADATFATFKMFALDAAGVSGFSQGTHRDVTRVDVAQHAREACEKSVAGRDPVALPAGTYDVVLEPPAVCELLEWLSFIAFGAREVRDGTSPLAGRRGEVITGANITIVDDALASGDLGFGIPFDRDGTLKSRVVLIDQGVAGAPVYDRLYAAREGVASTGHAAPPNGFDDAPVAQALAMSGGSDTVEDLLAGVERGLYVSRFHYVNGFLDPRRAVMTGLTRDGTFLIEAGRRTRGVRNMRFTDSVLEAFARVDGMTAARAAVPTWWSSAGAFVAPAVRIRGLKFSGGGVETPG